MCSMFLISPFQGASNAGKRRTLSSTIVRKCRTVASVKAALGNPVRPKKMVLGMQRAEKLASTSENNRGLARHEQLKKTTEERKWSHLLLFNGENADNPFFVSIVQYVLTNEHLLNIQLM